MEHLLSTVRLLLLALSLCRRALIAGLTAYDTIQAAINAAPTPSKSNATICICPGVYEEQLIVNKSGHTIFQGYSEATDDYSQNKVTIQFSRGIGTQGTSGSNTDGATIYAKGNYFHAFNINFRNNFGTQDMASLGFAVQSRKFAALYDCQIYGNQDTLSISYTVEPAPGTGPFTNVGLGRPWNSFHT